MQAAQLAGDRLEVVEDVVVRQGSGELAAQRRREGAVAAAEQERREHPVPAVAVDGHDDADVVEERLQGR